MAAILKNVKCCVAGRPILMKFGIVVHINPLNPVGNQKFENPRWQTSVAFKS